MQSTTLRLLAAAAAGTSAILYYLIGFGVLFIGESTTGENDILGFGLTVGTVFLVAALLLLRFRSPWILGAVAGVDLVVIVGYVAMAGIRLPPFEPWGLTIKALQVVVLVALGMLLRRRGRNASRLQPSPG